LGTGRPLNAAYDQRPAEYDHLRDCWLNQRRLEFLSERLRAEPAGRVRNVFEVGSGTGWLLGRLAAEFPRVAFWGVDPLTQYVEYARATHCAASNLTFFEGAAEWVDTLNVPAADVILSNDVLHHVASEDLAVRSITRIAGPNCVWHSIEPNCWNVYSFVRQAATPGERVFRPGRFSRLTHNSGWKKRTAAYLFLVPPFVREAPEWAKALERKLEWVAFLGGGVYQRFELAGPKDVTAPGI